MPVGIQQFAWRGRRSVSRKGASRMGVLRTGVLRMRGFRSFARRVHGFCFDRSGAKRAYGSGRARLRVAAGLSTRDMSARRHRYTGRRAAGRAVHRLGTLLSMPPQYGLHLMGE